MDEFGVDGSVTAIRVFKDGFVCGVQLDESHCELQAWAVDASVNPLSFERKTSFKSCCLKETKAINGRINDIITVNDTVVAATERGSLDFFKGAELNSLGSSLHLHSYPDGSSAACTSIALQTNTENVLASVGEDGAFSLVDLSARSLVKKLRLNDRAIRSVTWKDQSTAVLACSNALIFIDVRANEQVLAIEARSSLYTAVQAHLQQSFKLCAGDESGTLTFFDLRNAAQHESTHLKVHQTDILRLRTPPAEPDRSFSCGLDGVVGSMKWPDARTKTEVKKINFPAFSLALNDCDYNFEKNWLVCAGDAGFLGFQQLL